MADVKVPDLSATVHRVTEDELPQYVERVIYKFNIRSYAFTNIAQLRMKHKIDADIRTDDWPDFNCTIIKLPTSEGLAVAMFICKSQENSEKLLLTTKFNENSLYLVIDQQTCNYVKSLTMPWPAGFADRNLLNFKSFYFPGNIRDLPSWSCPKGTFTAKLKVDHAYYINKFWKVFKSQDQLEFLKYVIKNCISVGLFLDDDPSKPVSWAFLSNFGHITAVYTLEEHQRKGYSRMTMLCLMEQILEADMVPILVIKVNNTPSIKLCTGLGFVEAFDTTFTLYS